MKNNRKVNNLNDEIQMPLPTNFGITVACKDQYANMRHSGPSHQISPSWLTLFTVAISEILLHAYQN